MLTDEALAKLAATLPAAPEAEIRRVLQSFHLAKLGPACLLNPEVRASVDQAVDLFAGELRRRREEASTDATD